MKNIKRFILTVVLSILTLVTCGLGLVSCSVFQSLEITFKQQPYVYERGGVADAYDFIEKQSGVNYTFGFSYLKISDAGETVSTETSYLTGNTIYLKEATRYTLYVTASKGGRSVSGSTTFDVVGETPVLLPPSLSMIYKLGDSVRASILLDKASPIVLPASCKIVMDYYTYQESQAPTLESAGNSNPKTKIELDSENPMQKVTFDQLGLYEFHMIAYNGEKKAEASFKVKVLPDQTMPVAGISAYKNAEFGETWDGAIDSSVIRLIGSPELSKASYAVLEDEYVSGQVARFEFYGKNMPSYIGFFNQDDPNAVDPNSLTSGTGFVFTVERAGSATSARVYGCTRMASDTTSLRASNTSTPIENFGFETLEEDKHYFFDICMKASGVVYEHSGYGAPWMEGKKAQRISLYYSLYEVNDDGSYSIIYHSSATRFETSCGGSFFEEGQAIKGKLVAYSAISKDVTFKYYKDTLLNKNFNAKDMVYDEETHTLTWKPVDGATHYIVTTGNVSSDRTAVLDASVTSYDFTKLYENLDLFKTLDINVYASIGNNTFSGKKYSYTLTKAPVELDDIYVSATGGRVTDYDETAGTLDVVLEGSKAQKAADFQKETGYLAFNSEYVLNENGTYIDVYFAGNNMPQVEFFATDVLGNVMNASADTTSKGFIVTNGHAHPSAYTATPSGSVGGYSNYQLFYKYGVTSYNRLVSGSSLGGALIPDTLTDGVYEYATKETVDGAERETQTSITYSNFSMYSLMKRQAPTQSYRYTVGMYRGIDGRVWLDSKLFKVNGETESLFAKWLTPVVISTAVKEVKDENGAVITPASPAKTTLSQSERISGKIVVHAAYKGEVATIGENAYTKFTCSQPYTGTKTSESVLYNGTIDETTGVVSLGGGYYLNGSNHTKDAGYIVLTSDSADGKFTLDKDGTYVETRFTGNNMPTINFFGNNVLGNPFSDGESNGYVVTNGNAAPTTYHTYHEATTKGLWNQNIANAYANGSFTKDPTACKYNGVANYLSFFTFGVSDYNKFTQDTFKEGAYDRSNSLKVALYKDLTWTYDYELGYSKLSMYSLMQNETQAWRYVVGVYLGNDNKVYVDAKLYKVVSATDDGELFAAVTLVADTLSGGVVRSGYISIHAALKGTQTNVEANGGTYNTEFAYLAPYKGNASARA